MVDASMPFVQWSLLLVGSYLLGSIPFSQVMAKMDGVDLREVGSGNVGAGNLKRHVGLWWAVVAGLLDGLKGTAAVLVATRSLGFETWEAGIAGMAAVAGHNWSIFMRSRSGRGLATSAGILLGIYWPYLIWTTGWSLVGWKIGGGPAGFMGWVFLPIVALTLERPTAEALMLAVLAVMLLGRRMQGNPTSPRGLAPALRRAFYDTDLEAEQLAESATDPLTS